MKLSLNSFAQSPIFFILVSAIKQHYLRNSSGRKKHARSTSVRMIARSRRVCGSWTSRFACLVKDLLKDVFDWENFSRCSAKMRSAKDSMTRKARNRQWKSNKTLLRPGTTREVKLWGLLAYGLLITRYRERKTDSMKPEDCKKFHRLRKLRGSWNFRRRFKLWHRSVRKLAMFDLLVPALSTETHRC